jgi:predicted Zn-dependent protease
LGRYEEAERALEKALERSPGEPAVRMQLGILRLRQGRRSEAVELIEGVSGDVQDMGKDLRTMYQTARRELGQAPLESTEAE